MQRSWAVDGFDSPVEQEGSGVVAALGRGRGGHSWAGLCMAGHWVLGDRADQALGAVTSFF